MKKMMVIFTLFNILLLYFSFNQWLDKKSAQAKVTELKDSIQQMQQQVETDNRIVINNEQNKRELENKSQQRQEQINEQLKDNNCANQFVPMPVSASLYNRAKNLRESANTSQFIK